jgi:uncharacterized membrane protein (UPF0127 family)
VAAFVAVMAIGGGAYLSTLGGGDGDGNAGVAALMPTPTGAAVAGVLPTPASPPTGIDPEFERFAPAVVVPDGFAPIPVRAACSPEDQSDVGLSRVAALPVGSGLLYDSGDEIEVVAGWNTLDYDFPVDIVWISNGATGLVVQDVVEGVPTDTLRLSTPGRIRYALELNAGAAGELGLEPQRTVTVASPCTTNVISPPPVSVSPTGVTSVTISASNGLATLHVDAVGFQEDGSVVLQLAFTADTAETVAWTSDVGNPAIFLTDADNTIIPSVEVTGALAQEIPDGLQPGERLAGTHRFVLPDVAYRGVLTLHYPNHRDISFQVAE